MTIAIVVFLIVLAIVALRILTEDERDDRAQDFDWQHMGEHRARYEASSNERRNAP